MSGSSDSYEINIEKYKGSIPKNAASIVAQYTPRECKIIIMQYYAVHKMRHYYNKHDATFSKFSNRIGIAANRGLNLANYLENDVTYLYGDDEDRSGLLLYCPVEEEEEGNVTWKVCQVINHDDKRVENYHGPKVTRIRENLANKLFDFLTNDNDDNREKAPNGWGKLKFNDDKGDDFAEEDKEGKGEVSH